MLKRVFTAFLGTRHEREKKRLMPIVEAIHSHEERLAGVSEDELRAQTEKFRAQLRERTAPIEARIAELKDEKRVAADATDRERLDNELSGADGSGGAEGELRHAIAETLDEILPEAFATVREASRRLLGTTVSVTGRDLEWNMVPASSSTSARSPRWRRVKGRRSSPRFRSTSTHCRGGARIW